MYCKYTKQIDYKTFKRAKNISLTASKLKFLVFYHTNSPGCKIFITIISFCATR